ncbi:NUDIX domain-containing protein [Tumebacillus permanentifrigoris]|uniref:ADP-ribose pyrophosphatase YjhB (NUDIX family) n=1 Tax=Tumebacillus permanentifrigoris TaxID=378543 RepID=A0A316D873_9BACL|nr:NUDIX domain-containing protein [Tumebacillus permanentifrigoris]PWK13043.1 ADP-ribose pyrophosphatase YjhB (NUDIX family) [Tumebacillus permanentifrigoris]
MGTPENAANYTAKKYRTPDGAPCDIVIFTIATVEAQIHKKSLPRRELQVLLIQRKAWPDEGKWALPGGFSMPTESLYESARRELQEETSVESPYLEYFNVYSTPNRDPRGWIISHAYFALVQESILANRRAADDAADVKLFSVDEALNTLHLAFDHHEILRDARARVQHKMLTTTIAREFLPEEFTIVELYQVIQTVCPDFEDPNFKRKVTATKTRQGLIEEARDDQGVKKTTNRNSQRHAQLYRFTDYEPIVSIYQ